MNIAKNLLVLSLLLIGHAEVNAEDANAKEITVYRSPTCGCCGKWLDHLQKEGFKVKDIVTNDVQALKDKYGISAELASCHTAIINGYVIEGHVPASDIATLLKLKPKLTGITVPGMVNGSPGMEMGSEADAYNVVSFDDKHNHQVFKSYPAK